MSTSPAPHGARERVLLLTNDDGALAPGIQALARALAESGLARVVVVGPDSNRTGAGHGASLGETDVVLQPAAGLPVETYTCSGTPVDSVLCGLALLEERGLQPDLVVSGLPNLVVSGVNDGWNVAQDIFTSGTVGAANQAALDGLPAIAVSLATDLGTPGASPHWDVATRAAVALVREFFARDGIAQGTFWNVNVPDVPSAALADEEPTWTLLDERPYEARLVDEPYDPNARRHVFRIARDWQTYDPRSPADMPAVAHQRVSVTPLRGFSFDATAHVRHGGSTGHALLDAARRIVLDARAHLERRGTSARRTGERRVVLLVNNDGARADGIQTLARRLAADDDLRVIVVAPDDDRTGRRHGASLGGDDVVLERVDGLWDETWTCSGSPVDSVLCALTMLAREGVRPDLVVSGVNDGWNVARDVHSSGTVAAANQAMISGIPAIAASLATDLTERLVPQWNTAADAVHAVVRRALAEGIRAHCFWNVNVPNVPLAQLDRTPLWTEPEQRPYRARLRERRGEVRVFRIEREWRRVAAGTATDMSAVASGRVSVTGYRGYQLDLAAYLQHALLRTRLTTHARRLLARTPFGGARAPSRRR